MPEKRKRKYIILILILTILVLIAGILIGIYLMDKSEENLDYNNYDDNTESSKAILEYYSWSDEELYIKDHADIFNQIQSDCEVRINLLEAETYDNDIIAILESDQQIDLMGVRGIARMFQYHDQFFLKDITRNIQNSDIDITHFGNMFNNIVIDSRYYGLPTRITSWALIYNKDIFDKANLEYPKQMTWEEYAVLAKELTDKSGDEVIWGGVFMPWVMEFAGIQKGSYLIDDNLEPFEVSLQMLNRFYNIDKSHPPLEAMTENDDLHMDLFKEGKVAMIPQGEWVVGMLLDAKEKNETNINWDIAPMPIFEGQKPGTTWGQYQFTSVTSKSLYTNEAFDFLSFLCSEAGAKIYAKYGMISSYDSKEIRKIYENSVGDKNTDVFFDSYRIQEQPAYNHYFDIQEIFSDQGEEYLLGEKTIEEAMKDFRKERRELLE